MKRPRVAVVGGGIAGLSVAHRLSILLPEAEITLIEARSRLGGIVSTVRRDGYTIEEGPDSFLSSKPAGLKLCTELGLADRFQSTIRGRRARVWWDGQLLPLPEGLSGLVPVRPETLTGSALLSQAGKERLAQEADIPARPIGGDETIGSFMTRRFGQEAYHRLIEPLMAGIYAGDGDQLSLAATFPQLRAFELEYGSVMRGVLTHTATSDGGPSPPPFLTPREGMQSIVDALVTQLANITVACNRRATRLDHRSDGYLLTLDDERSIIADELVLALPAHVAAELLGNVHADLSAVLGSIPYASTATLSIAFPASAVRCPLDGTGYVVPRVANRPVLAATWSSSKFEHRAPADRVLLRAFVGRYGREETLAGSDLELLEVVRAEFREVLGITAAPETWVVSTWPRSMPQYTLGHLERVASARRMLQELPGLSLAGSAYRGVGIPDCIAGGDKVASEIAERYRPGGIDS